MVTILRDEPSDEDKLGSDSSNQGPHDRIAAAIENRIVSPEGGGAIGLEGEYGSGKSTIIRLLEDRLEQRDDSENICFIIFDAWAHEGDPLRRAFLETLISEMLERPGWLPTKKWIEKKERLSQRHRKTEEQRKTRPSGFGIAMALATACVPIGHFVAREAAKSATFDLNPKLEIAWSVVLGIVLLIMPLIVPLGRILERIAMTGLYKTFHRSSRERSKFFRRWRYRLYSLWSSAPQRYRDVFAAEQFNFLAANATLDSETNTFESPDPTSIEFEDDFRELLEDALDDPDHRIVLVVDNLDRLTAEQSIRVWSSLQAFVGHPELNGERWQTQFSLLVPYTPSAIQKLWLKARTISSAESFFEKTFRIRYRTPPPTLSNWQDHLRRLLCDAISEMPVAERQRVLEVFELIRRERAERIVPRQLKLSVNQLAIQYELWNSDGVTIPGPCLAYSVLHGVPPEEMEECLRSGFRNPDADDKADKNPFPSPGAIQICGRDLVEYLAAIHFNVERQEAIQLLLEDSIENALLKGQPDQMLALRERHERGFWLSLRAIVRSQVGSLGTEEISTWSRSLTFLEEAELPPEGRRIREYVRTRIAVFNDAWIPLKEETITGLVAWSHLDPSDETKQAVIKIAERTLQSKKQDLDLQLKIQLVDELRSAGLNPSRQGAWKVRMEAADWLDSVAANASDEEGNVYIDPSCKTKQLVEVLCQRTASEGETPDTCALTESDIASLEVLKRVRDRVESPELVDALAAKIVANASTQSVEAVDAIAKCLTLLHALKLVGEETARTRLNDDAFLRHIWNGLTNAIALNKNANELIVTICCTDEEKDFDTSFKSVPEPTRTHVKDLMANGNMSLTAGIWEQMRKFGIKGVVGLLAGRSSSGLDLDLVEHAFTSGDLLWAMPKWYFAVNAGWLESGLEKRKTNFADVVAELAKDGKAVKYLLFNFDIKKVKHITAANAFLDYAGDDVSLEVAERCSTAISKVTSDEWADDFENGFSIAKIAHRLSNEHELVSVDANFGTASQSLVLGLVRGDRNLDEDETEILAHLISELPTTVRTELGTQSLNHLRSNEKGMNGSLVRLVGNAICESTTSLPPDDTAKLVARTLASGSNDSRKWCIEWLGRYDADSGMSPDAKDLLQRQLQASEDETSDEDALNDLRALREKLGVESADRVDPNEESNIDEGTEDGASS